MHKFRLLLSRITEPVLWTLALLPLDMMISASQTESLFPAWICLLMTLALGCVLVILRKRRFLFALGSGILIFLSLRPYYSHFSIFFLPGLSSLVLLYLASSKSQDKEHVNPAIRTIGGVVLYLAAQYAVSRTSVPTFEKYGMIRIPILAGFLLFFLIEILMVDSRTIQDEAVGDSIPSSVIHHNLVLAVSAFLISVFVALIPQIALFLSRLWELFIQGVKAVAHFLMSLIPESQEIVGETGGAEVSEMMQVEASEPNMVAIWLERIVAVLAGIALILILIKAISILGKKLKHLLIKIKGLLSAYMKNTTLDYVDEISDTRMTQEKHASLFFRRKKKRAYHEDMTNSEKVRYTYGVMLDQHPDWKASNTVRENLHDEKATIYEKVRYAEQEASQEDLNAFQQILHLKQ